MMNQRRPRLTYLVEFLLIVALLGMSAYLEKVKGIHPCPLCIIQRLVLIALGILFFIAMCLKINKNRHLFFSTVGLITSFIGIVLSGRQVWLQHFPTISLGECGMSLHYMLKVFSIPETMKHVWQGGTECSQQGWVWMHLSLAEWSLVWFALFFIAMIIQIKYIFVARHV